VTEVSVDDRTLGRGSGDLDLRLGIGGICFFLDTASLFPLFGLPARLDA
jgi:hypothetical protein